MSTVYVQARVGVLEAGFFSSLPFETTQLIAEDAQPLFARAAAKAAADDLPVMMVLEAACAQSPEVTVELEVRALH